jgi:hypothetical protein
METPAGAGSRREWIGLGIWAVENFDPPRGSEVSSFLGEAGFGF